MLDISQNIISILVNDTTLWTLMNPNATTPPVLPNKSIFTGPTDIVREQQATLGYPTINVFAVSESFRTVPQGARDSRIQVDLWSRNSESQVQQIYERVEALINFTNGNFNSTHIWWERSGGMRSSYEGDVRLWHWACDFIVWSI